MSRWDGKVPFDARTGDQQTYPAKAWGSYDPKTGERSADLDPHWGDNGEFEDVLTFEGFARGYSAAHALFRRADGTRCTMFLTDLEDAIPRLCDGRIRARFTWCKRGQNFGIKLMPGTQPLVQAVHTGKA